MQITFLPELAASFILIFARIGTMVMLLPGLGERGVPVRMRLTAALLLGLVMFPVLRAYLPSPMPVDPTLGVLLVGEMGVGFVLGATGRLLMSSMQTAGTVIAQQLGLGFVTSVDPSQGQQGALMGSFLSLVGVALIFATDLHHIAIAALGKSYEIFRPGTLPSMGDAVTYGIQLIAQAFRIGVQIAAPVTVFAVVFNIGLGILSKLMPQMQVFFVSVPATILVGFALLALVLTTMMGVYLVSIEEGLGTLTLMR